MHDSFFLMVPAKASGILSGFLGRRPFFLFGGIGFTAFKRLFEKQVPSVIDVFLFQRAGSWHMRLVKGPLFWAGPYAFFTKDADGPVVVIGLPAFHILGKNNGAGRTDRFAAAAPDTKVFPETDQPPVAGRKVGFLRRVGYGDRFSEQISNGVKKCFHHQKFFTLPYRTGKGHTKR